MASKRKTCAFEKSDGTPCRGQFGLCDKCGHCVAHCEHRRAVLLEAASKGAEKTNAIHKKKPFDLDAPTTLDDVTVWLSRTIHDVRTGALKPNDGDKLARMLRELREALRDELREEADALREKVEQLTKLRRIK